jgi:NAD-dependent deacetylase
MNGHNMKKIVVFTGAGVSEESGIKTFRDSGGLWEEYDIMDVATPQAWERQPEVVLEFYNARRKQALNAEPNDAHRIIASMQNQYDVQVITQNIDNLHERAGSENVLHLHGEIMKAKSSIDHNLIYPIDGEEIKWGEKCELGSQLRPHVVWFGEAVPAMYEAEKIMPTASVLIIVGTSLNVYPAAGLIHHVNSDCKIYLVDPGQPMIPYSLEVDWIKEKAGKGMKIISERLSKA